MKKPFLDYMGREVAEKSHKFTDYYAVLNIPHFASDDEIRKAYHKERYTPDSEKHKAYQVLTNPLNRFLYDQQLLICIENWNGPTYKPFILIESSYLKVQTAQIKKNTPEEEVKEWIQVLTEMCLVK